MTGGYYLVECPLLGNLPPLLLDYDLTDAELQRFASWANELRDRADSQALLDLFGGHPRLKGVSRSKDAIGTVLEELMQVTAAPRWAPRGGRGIGQLLYAAHLLGQDPITHACRLLENAARRRSLQDESDASLNVATENEDGEPIEAYEPGDLHLDETERAADALCEQDATERWIASQKTPALQSAARLIASGGTIDEVEQLAGVTDAQQRPLRDWLKDRSAQALSEVHAVEVSRVRLAGKMTLPSAESVRREARETFRPKPERPIAKGGKLPPGLWIELTGQERRAVNLVYDRELQPAILEATGLTRQRLAELRRLIRQYGARIPSSGRGRLRSDTYEQPQPSNADTVRDDVERFNQRLRADLERFNRGLGSRA
jgi:hypothetical protein